MTVGVPPIGRTGEIALLHRLLEDATDGATSVVAITGDAGIGKTTLLGTLVELARDKGFLVGRASGAPLEGEFAFGVARQAFESLLAAWPEADRQAVLQAAPQRAEQVLAGESAITNVQPCSEFETYHALYRLAGLLARRAPLLLAVDDVQFADPPSLRWMAFAARRFTTAPVLIAVCATDGEPALAEDPLLDLTATAHRIRLHGLRPEHTAEVVRQALGPATCDELVAACHEVTHGTPFLLWALLDTLGRQPERLSPQRVFELGSPTITERLRARLRGCAGATELAEAVAVLGTAADFGRACAVADLDDAAAARALDGLVRMKVLRNSQPLAFVHGVVRNAVLDDMPPVARIAGARRAAESLYVANAADDQVAAHLLNAGPVDLPWAADLLCRVAGRACAQGAPDVAVIYLRHALRQPLRPERRAGVLHDLGVAELAADSPAGIARLLTALDEAGSPEKAASVALNLIPALYTAGDHRQGIALADRVVAGLGPHARNLAWRLRCLAWVGAFTGIATVAEAREREEALHADLPDDPALLRARQALLAIRHTWRGGSSAAAVVHAKQALANADLAMFHQPYYFALFALINADELEHVEQLSRAVQRLAERSGSLHIAAVALLVRGAIGQVRGDLDEAGELLASALDLFTEWGAAGDGDDVLVCLTRLVNVLVDQGELDRAHQLLDSRGLLGSRPDHIRDNFVLFARGRFRMASGDPASALEDLLECGRRLEIWQMDNPAILPWRSEAALACVATGQWERAQQLAGAELHAARRWGTARTEGVALHALGRASPASMAGSLLTDATLCLERSPAGLALARALLDLGAFARGQGDLDGARTHLRRAAELADRSHAKPLVARISDELAALDQLTARRAGPWGETLTKQECRVADLALEGQTNRQIAETMSVTRRCVEQHLSSVYRKLGVKGRSELGWTEGSRLGILR